MSENKKTNELFRIDINQSVDSFSKLDINMQSKIIDIASSKSTEGILDKFFGTDRKRNATYVSMIIILVLILYGSVVSFNLPSDYSNEIWKMIIPIITLSIGYVFGNDDK